MDYNKIQIKGLILSDGSDEEYHFYLPSDDTETTETTIHSLKLGIDDWLKVFDRMDKRETECLAVDETGNLTKIMIRKSERHIAEGIRWRVFARDGYTCQYCLRKGIPMTVDHLVTWTAGGPTIDENLLTSCRKCNQIRADMPFAEWLQSNKYQKRSKDVSSELRERLLRLSETLDDIPKSFFNAFNVR